MCACVRVYLCMGWDLLVEHSGIRAAYPIVAIKVACLTTSSNIGVQVLALPLAGWRTSPRYFTFPCFRCLTYGRDSIASASYYCED